MTLRQTLGHIIALYGEKIFSGNMLKEESLEFEELLRKLNDGSTVFQGADDKRFLESLWQVLKNHNMKYEPLERYDAWQEEKRDAPPAQYSLGLMYYHGEGVAVNYAEAEKWLRRAAAQRFPGAEEVLSEILWKRNGF